MSIIRGSGDQAGGRRWLALAAAAAVTVALAACGSAAGSGKASSSSAKGGGTNLTMWLVTTGPSPANTVINQSVSAFEKNHPGDTITVNYIGVACSTGHIFDSSYKTGKPASFPLNQVIKGWQDGIPGMKVGGQRLLGGEQGLLCDVLRLRALLVGDHVRRERAVQGLLELGEQSDLAVERVDGIDFVLQI